MTAMEHSCYDMYEKAKSEAQKTVRGTKMIKHGAGWRALHDEGGSGGI